MRILGAVLCAFLVFVSSAGAADAQTPASDTMRTVDLPDGWYLVREIPGGWLMEHTDGSRARIVQCEQDDHYRVAWQVTFSRDGMECVEAQVMRVEGHDTGVANTQIRIRIEPDGGRQVRAVTAPWPPNVVSAFLQSLNPATRHAVCTR